MRLISAAEERVMRAVVDTLSTEITRLQAQNADLLATVLALKAQGAVVPTVGLTKREPDGVSQVIAAVAGSNTALRRQLGAFARELLANGADEGEVLQRLRKWDDASDGVED